MNPTKIRMKIGANEFEAEGDASIVQSQFEAFKSLVESVPRQIAKSNDANATDVQQNQSLSQTYLSKIMHVSGRVVSLTALPTSTEDAALLVILGNKDLRNNPSVTGQEIGDGLAQSGRPVPRVDRIMEKALADAQVLKTGVRRATRYRLTNQGLVKAQAIADELIKSLP